MPEISRFFGIVIKMFFDDHHPPHFHVEYGEFKATIDIKENKILKGELPPRQLNLVLAWAIIHEKELLKNFEILRKNPQTWKKIEPLK